MTDARWLDEQLAAVLDQERMTWLAHRRDDVVRRPDQLGEVFPAVARRVGRESLDGGWTVDEAARAVLLAALAAVLSGDDLAVAVSGVYRYGDAAEKRAALRALDVRDVAVALGNRAVPLLADAIRTNDQRLLAAALGPYATEHLDVAAFRQAVLKCVFAGVPLAVVDGLPDRADAELTQPVAGNETRQHFGRKPRASPRGQTVDMEDVLHPNRHPEQRRPLNPLRPPPLHRHRLAPKPLPPPRLIHECTKIRIHLVDQVTQLIDVRRDAELTAPNPRNVANEIPCPHIPTFSARPARQSRRRLVGREDAPRHRRLRLDKGMRTRNPSHEETGG